MTKTIHILLTAFILTATCYPTPEPKSRNCVVQSLLTELMEKCKVIKKLEQKAVEIIFSAIKANPGKNFVLHMQFEHGIHLSDDFFDRLKVKEPDQTYANSKKHCPICKNTDELMDEIRAQNKKIDNLRTELHKLGIGIDDGRILNNDLSASDITPQKINVKYINRLKA
ncbi:hypothetical protein HOD08_01535 [bacterium]|nr:hypothetical protein [bacterium]